jgi:CheY-like chemotaxis protein
METEYQKDLPELYCNESEVREALTNLVFNAVDALPKGGQIWLCARAVQLEVKNGEAAKPNHMIIEVKDNGLGMDEQTRQRCLEPFFSTKQLRGGSGLGLAMVYGTMERHEGRIEMESELNKGTTARLIFPLREAPKSKDVTATRPDAEPQRPLNVLCIDDEPLLRELLKDVLEFQHHRVETAEGGEEGLRLFEGAAKRGKPFDVVITDLGMPGLNGRQVAEKIREEAPWTGIVMLTGWGMMLEERGEKTGNADVVLSKPPRVDELVQVVTRVAASKAAALDALRSPGRLTAK